jgi:hypothetical protein
MADLVANFNGKVKVKSQAELTVPAGWWIGRLDVWTNRQHSATLGHGVVAAFARK